MNDVLATIITNNDIITNDDEIEVKIVYPSEATVRAPSGDDRSTGASVVDIIVVVEGGRMVVDVKVESMEVGNDAVVVVVVAAEGESIGTTVVLGVVFDSGEEESAAVVASVVAVVVAVDEEVSSMSMADTPLHSSKASTHGSRHDVHSSDSSANSLLGGIERVTVCERDDNDNDLQA